MRKVAPAYPSIARSARITGSVIVEVTIDESGNVIAARATKGPMIFYEAAVKAAMQWKYRPARRGDQFVGDKQPISFNFTL